MFVVSILFACSDEGIPSGRWLRGDLHVHSSVGSNDTDGAGLPDALGPAMETAGLDFIFLTDHSNSQGSMDCPGGDVEECPNQGPERSEAPAGSAWPPGVYLASELSPVDSLEGDAGPNGHVGCLGFSGDEAFTDRPPGEVPAAEALAWCRDRGGFAIVNHPFAAAEWITFDWSSEDFDAVEVYNGGLRFDPWDAEGLDAWQQRVEAGRTIVPVGGSDCHRWGLTDPDALLDPPLGWPQTRVLSRGEGEAGVLEGLRAGRVVVAEPGTELELVARRRGMVAGPGESLEGPATLTITASAEVGGLVLQLVELGGGVAAQAPLEAGEASLEVEVEAGLYQARVWPAGELEAQQGGVALSGVLTVR